MSKINRRKFLQGAVGALGGTIAAGGPLAVILTEQHKHENMVEMYASDCPSITLWFNGEDVSWRTVACRVHVQPGKTVRGWADFMVVDERGHIIGEPIIYRRYGRVKWTSHKS